jgi:hypothetical protein
VPCARAGLRLSGAQWAKPKIATVVRHEVAGSVEEDGSAGFVIRRPMAVGHVTFVEGMNRHKRRKAKAQTRFPGA